MGINLPIASRRKLGSKHQGIKLKFSLGLSAANWEIPKLTSL